MVCLLINVEYFMYFQPGIVNRIHFSQGPNGLFTMKNIFSEVDSALQRLEIWGWASKVPDSGVSSTTPPLAFGAGGSWGIGVGSWVGVGWVMLELGWVVWSWSWSWVVWSWLGWSWVELSCLQLGWHRGADEERTRASWMKRNRLLLGILKEAALEWGCMWGK